MHNANLVINTDSDQIIVAEALTASNLRKVGRRDCTRESRGLPLLVGRVAKQPVEGSRGAMKCPLVDGVLGRAKSPRE